MNWSLASEWFTVWGNAYRNPDRSLLMNHLKCVRDEAGNADAGSGGDEAGNAFCKRSYKLECDVPVCTKDFDEVCDDVKEYLSKVPNLYVEDAAVASGRLLETRMACATSYGVRERG